MEIIAGLLILSWPVVGIVCHLVMCEQMETWCGTPIWEEPSTYMMIFVAAVAGWLMLFSLKDFNER